MALRIRLARGGTKKRPHYNIVIVGFALAARRPLHREDRLLQSAAAVGSCRPHQARPRRRQGLDRQGRGGVRPRAQVAGQCRPGEGARAQQSAKGPAQEEGAGARRRGRQGRGSSRRPLEPKRGLIGARRSSRRRHRRAGPEGRGEGQALHRHARGAAALWRAARQDGRKLEVTAFRPAKEGEAVISFEGVADRSAAEALKGIELFVAARGAARHGGRGILSRRPDRPGSAGQRRPRAGQGRRHPQLRRQRCDGDRPRRWRQRACWPSPAKPCRPSISRAGALSSRCPKTMKAMIMSSDRCLHRRAGLASASRP